MNDLDRNKAMARQLVEAMSRGDTQWFMDNYTDDVEVWTMGSTLISGRYDKAAVARYAAGIFEAFPRGIQFTIHGMVAEGDTVAMETESMGEHVSGKTYNNFYHMLVKFRDGKIRLLKEYLDTELVTEVLAGGQRPGPGAR
jgi:ketosteroid isomerase-like protein